MKNSKCALLKMNDVQKNYIHIDEATRTISFSMQIGPVKEEGFHGVQVVDILEYVKHLFDSLNKEYPCRENSLTITKIEEGLHWQQARTKDRELRGVEGYNKA